MPWRHASNVWVSRKQCLGVADGSSQHGMAVELHLTAALFAHADTRQRVNDFLQR